VMVQFLRSKDAKEAKAAGAMINIAEGHGTAVDAGNFFRNAEIKSKEDLEKHGISMKEGVADQGFAISRLSDPVFKRVLTGDIPPDRAALIGSYGLAPEHEAEAVKQMDAGSKGDKKMGMGRLKERLDNARAAQSKTVKTFDMFGENKDEVSMAGYRADLQSDIKNQLMYHKGLFGGVPKAKAAKKLATAGNVIDTEESGKISEDARLALDWFDKLKNDPRTGISDQLNAAAERVHNGEKRKKVFDEIYQHVLGEIRKVHANPEGLLSGAFREGLQGSPGRSGAEASQPVPALSGVSGRTGYGQGASHGRRLTYERSVDLRRWLRSRIRSAAPVRAFASGGHQ
jgi:hypothetical protein